MDAHNFYRNGYFERVVAPVFVNKTVIVLTNRNNIAKLQGNSKLPWKNMVYIETPEEESLAAYEDIKKRIDAELLQRAPEAVVLFFALGPVGKGLIKEYSTMGYQGIDIGKGIETIFTNESIEYLI